MKITKQFVFNTPIFDYKNKLVDYARIEGKGYLHTNNFETDESDNDPESLFSFDIERVTLQSGTDITEAYKLSVLLRDSLADIIEKATLAHMEYIFKINVDAHYGREVASGLGYTSPHAKLAREDYQRDAMETMRRDNEQQSGE